ncbi:unnamed protein product [Rotaria socialis]|uniref:Uncharacterized protein n=1 Tax=Rotaria socialis TaxID=392032 RepID=A0A821BCX8_9BILA|nr:unnamed protein product [Rotaria socialis]
MKPKAATSKSFDRSKLLLFKFLAHQIHPFAYGVNTFLQPALDDCRVLLQNNPQDTFKMLLSFAQTFIRFAPDSELIYDDIQQFASKLKDAIDECFIWLDTDSIEQSSQDIESVRQNLLSIIQQENKSNTLYANMYKNMSTDLTNLQKTNSLPTELQSLSFNNSCDTTASLEMINNKDIGMKGNGNSDFHEFEALIAKRMMAHSFLPVSNIPSIHNEKPSTLPLPTQNTVASSMGTSVTTKLMNQMKNLTVSSKTPDPMSLRPMSTASFQSEYEIKYALESSSKTQTETIAEFPPCHTPASILFNDDAQTVNHDEDCDMERGQQYYLDPIFRDPSAASHEWHQIKQSLSIVIEQSHMNNTTAAHRQHVTDEYIRQFGYQQTRPILRGDLCMTYGTPQTGPQATCLPIGIALSHDESTLLSCDVHRSAQNVRLFDVETGQLKHTITGNQQMKFHRPSAVMSNSSNNILIVERDYIYVTEPDGRLIQTIGHRSIKQLYGIALFHDRYLLTIDSKATDADTAENSRLLLFDPNNGRLVFEQPIMMNREPEEKLRERYVKHVVGNILPQTTSKPRFVAVHNDNIYIADLGRSLIYGTSIRNRFQYDCITVFGGHGRGDGEMIDPSGLFVDSNGNIISADSKNDRIQVFKSDGEYQTTLKLNERIKRPSGICTNRSGTKFYVSCYLAGCVRAFNITY